MNYPFAHAVLPEVASRGGPTMSSDPAFTSFWSEPSPAAATPGISSHELEAAIAAVQEAARSSAAEELASRERAAAASIESALSAARHEWVNQAADEFTRIFADQLDGMRRQIAAGIVRAVLPLVAEEFRRRAVDDLAQAAEQAIAPERHSKVRIRGPKDLVAELSRRLEERRIANVCEDGDQLHLELHLDETALVVGIGDFVRRLEGVMA